VSFNGNSQLEQIVPANWKLHDVLTIPERAARYVAVATLPISHELKLYLQNTYPLGLYSHQAEAIESFLSEDANLCVATGTGSGKTEVFHVVARSILESDPAARVLALYPMKALGREQEDRWRAFFQSSGLVNEAQVQVGRIDGDVDTKARERVLQQCRLVCATPDIVHSYLLPRIAEGDSGGEACRRFLKRLKLVVLDEVHTYRGVFGSNTAFLLRRLRHCILRLGGHPRFLAASATLAEGHLHLEELVGEEFVFIDDDRTASPRPELKIVLLNPPAPQDAINNTATLARNLVAAKQRFIVFVDSRKATELIATVIGRNVDEDSESQTYLDEEDLPKALSTLKTDLDLKEGTVLPFRAGYSAYDSTAIQNSLKSGHLAGVISTSALELGLDIGRLTAVGLVGVPESATSFWQRIGRIRPQAGGGVVYVINDGKPQSRLIFNSPKLLLGRPSARAALYLENEYIQYIHAMCLARAGGEDSAVSHVRDSGELLSPVEFPPGFARLCEDERNFSVPAHLQLLKDVAQDKPHYAFPLRSSDVQYAFKLATYGGEIDLGQASWSQVMSEAYPGAVYRYCTLPYRVVEVNRTARRIRLRKEKNYYTKPLQLPIQLFPNMRIQEGILGGLKIGEVYAVECKTQIYQKITGWAERRGSTESRYEYKNNEDLIRSWGIRLDQTQFDRTLRTTGVFITWPEITLNGANLDHMAELLFESLLFNIPFERADLISGSSKVRHSAVFLPEGTVSIGICDFTNGGLRLTKVLTDAGNLTRIVQGAVEMAQVWPEEVFVVREETITSMNCLLSRLGNSAIDTESIVPGLGVPDSPTARIRVLMPDSIGIVAKMMNRRVRVEKVFLKFDGLRYRVRYEEEAAVLADQDRFLKVEDVEPVPGMAQWGFYNEETGEAEFLENT
jgi:DEAD/DEAH box helicase domain-containing protein